MREATQKKQEFIRGILAENGAETNTHITEKVKKEFGTGIALKEIADIRKDMNIKSVRGRRAGAPAAGAEPLETPKKRGKKKAGTKKTAKDRGGPKKTVVSSTPSHILLVNGELITCSSRPEVEKESAKAIANGTLPEVYSRSEKPFEFVVRFYESTPKKPVD